MIDIFAICLNQYSILYLVKLQRINGKLIWKPCNLKISEDCLSIDEERDLFKKASEIYEEYQNALSADTIAEKIASTLNISYLGSKNFIVTNISPKNINIYIADYQNGDL